MRGGQRLVTMNTYHTYLGTAGHPSKKHPFISNPLLGKNARALS